MIIGTTCTGDDISARNAIASWKVAYPGARIILFGEETLNLADVMGTDWMPVKRYNGVPLLSDMVRVMHNVGHAHSVHAFVNADIMLFPLHRFLSYFAFESDPWFLTGLRIDVDIDREIMPSEMTVAWAGQVGATGKLQAPCGADWFMWLDGMFLDMPDFCVGRTTFDNYFIFAAQIARVAAFNATKLMLALHQNHTEHQQRYTGLLAQRNMRLMQEHFPEWQPRLGWVNHLPPLALINPDADDYFAMLAERNVERTIAPRIMSSIPKEIEALV